MIDQVHLGKLIELRLVETREDVPYVPVAGKTPCGNDSAEVEKTTLWTRQVMTSFPYFAVARKYHVSYCVVLWLSDVLDTTWPLCPPMPYHVARAFPSKSIRWDRDPMGQRKQLRRLGNRNVRGGAATRHLDRLFFGVSKKGRCNPQRPPGVTISAK
jgi:hypothetical protein